MLLREVLSHLRRVFPAAAKLADTVGSVEIYPLHSWNRLRDQIEHLGLGPRQQCVLGTFFGRRRS